MKAEVFGAIGYGTAVAIMVITVAILSGTNGALRHDLWLKSDDLQKAKREIASLEDSLRLSELKAAQAAENYMKLVEESKNATKGN